MATHQLNRPYFTHSAKERQSPGWGTPTGFLLGDAGRSYPGCAPPHDDCGGRPTSVAESLEAFAWAIVPSPSRSSARWGKRAMVGRGPTSPTVITTRGT